MTESKINLTEKKLTQQEAFAIKAHLYDLEVSNRGFFYKLLPFIQEKGFNTVENALKAVKQIQQNKEQEIKTIEGFTIYAVRNNYQPRTKQQQEENTQKTIKVADLSQEEIKQYFREAIQQNTTIENQGLDSAIDEAFLSTNQKIRFGEKKVNELVWHDGVGSVKNYKTGEYFQWATKDIDLKLVPTRTITKEELQQKEIARKNQEQELQEVKQQAQEEMRDIFTNAVKQNIYDNQYLKNKGIANMEIQNIAFDKEKIIIPLKNIKGEIKGLQYIYNNGKKYLARHTDKVGNFFAFEAQERQKYKDTIFLTEGFADGASINRSTGCKTFVAFDAGNLKAVAVEIRKIHPQEEITICADNDLKNQRETGINVGVKNASAACLDDSMNVIIPQYDDQKQYDKIDFNDMEKKHGSEFVSNKINDFFLSKNQEKALSKINNITDKKQRYEELKKMKYSLKNFNVQNQQQKEIFNKIYSCVETAKKELKKQFKI